MVCITSCGISLIFILGMIYMMFAVDKQATMSPFMRLLSPKQKDKYWEIINERRRIYFSGFGLGIILSALTLTARSYSGIKLSWLPTICLTGSITFLTTYFYYILAPKSDYMVRYLETKEQREAWLGIYKTMQFNYHLGLVLGLAAVIAGSYAVC